MSLEEKKDIVTTFMAGAGGGGLLEGIHAGELTHVAVVAFVGGIVGVIAKSIGTMITKRLFHKNSQP